MAKGVKISENVYKACKYMLLGGASDKEVSEHIGLSCFSCWKIRTTTDYEDFQNRFCGKRHGSKAVENVVLPEAVHENEESEMIILLKKNNQLLEKSNEINASIYALMCQLVEQL